MENKTKEFIEKSIKIHGDNYDYSKVEYINGNTDVKIICKKHNYQFDQRPNNHLNGANCPKCGLEARKEKRKTPVEDFKKKASEKHNNKFDYSKVIYENTDTDVIIICSVHGEFPQTPYHHIKSKYGCNKCSIKDSVAHRTKDSNKFLEELKERFGDKFDYSKVKYVNSKKDIILICKKHNKEFNMMPNKLLTAKLCCPDCVTDNKKIMNTKDIDDFKKEANEKHNNKFDYSKVIYINTNTDVTIICPEHNEIIITPYQHLNSPTGCQKCSGCYRRTQEEFINDSIKIHGDKYDYSNIEYIDNQIDISIYCKKHKNNFIQKPSMHLSGQGCRLCGYENSSEKRKYTKEEFIQMAKEVHPNNLDDYSLIDYVNLSTKINIKCNIHGNYPSLPADHIGGHRCSKCSKDKLSLQFRLTLDEFIKRSNIIHNNFFDYSEVKYINTDIKVDIKCPIHGIFPQTPHNHLNGAKCPTCKTKTESKLLEKIKIIYPTIQTQFRTNWCKNKKTDRCLPFDFVIEKYKIIIELDGLQHFKQVSNWQSPEEANKRDIYKMKCANQNGYSIIRLLQEDVYFDKYDWLDELKNNIEKIKKDNIVQNIFLCKNNEYIDFNNIDYTLINDSILSEEYNDIEIDNTIKKNNKKISILRKL